PVFFVGLLLCAIVLPLDYALMTAGMLLTHIAIALNRIFCAPFCIIYSAWFDRSAWPQYVQRWEAAHGSVKPEWERPLKRFSELSTWLTEGPPGSSTS